MTDMIINASVSVFDESFKDYTYGILTSEIKEDLANKLYDEVFEIFHLGCSLELKEASEGNWYIWVEDSDTQMRCYINFEVREIPSPIREICGYEVDVSSIHCPSDQSRCEWSLMEEDFERLSIPEEVRGVLRKEAYDYLFAEDEDEEENLYLEHTA